MDYSWTPRVLEMAETSSVDGLGREVLSRLLILPFNIWISVIDVRSSMIRYKFNAYCSCSLSLIQHSRGDFDDPAFIAAAFRDAETDQKVCLNSSMWIEGQVLTTKRENYCQLSCCSCISLAMTASNLSF